MENLFRKTPIISINPKAFSRLPEGPGVYGYIKDGRPVYVGKAVNLKNRLKSYLSNRLEDKTRKMVTDAEYVSYIKVGSELESLLLEAELIRTYQPVYNIISKDDKHALYIRVTNEKYPRVLTCRKIDTKSSDTKVFFGPFPSSFNVKAVLRILRRIFPYSDHKLGKKPCLLSQIGLCNPCPNKIEELKDNRDQSSETKRYRRNIKMLIKVMQRKNLAVEKDLIKEMTELGKEQNFEEAAAARDQLKRLEYISQDVTDTNLFLDNPNLLEDIRNKELKNLETILFKVGKIKISLKRIECFDIAHLSGVDTTASMVTFIEGEPAKEFYRHLRIRKAGPANDIAAMEEVAQMRVKHLKDWGKPDLIIVDGGKGQVNVFNKVLSEYQIPVVGLAKRYESLVIPAKSKVYGSYIVKRVPTGPALALLQRIRNEAHRFARRYHHILFEKSLLS